ncbi:phytoene desaturase family protein [Acuticoccus sp. MNP-M23]|uniref:phytoene desaturase family protein n=1 Tax=Acuticoccus sp. MNP-M23 TaxID=3072793 RepID=UPI00281531C6|nr:phytoene desaturase family protein [Acuticoccus sp. MNP-M23]WMS42149.1 phytoene desaturase family protein [Acuticoccus sp. MNP-M23]
MNHKTVVVGGGFGGLAAAHRLQSAGISTTLVERQPRLGGKARNVGVGSVLAPGGPTVLTMRHVFEELFDAGGERLEEAVSLAPLDTIAHHRWSASERLDLHADVDANTAAIADFAGAAEADGYRAFLADAARIYATVDGPFIRSPKPDLFALARAVGPLGASKIRPFDTMWSALSQHFADPRLRQLFGRYATYCGASPFAAPATLMLVAHVEQCGVWAIDGGAAALARAIGDSFERHGGTVLLDAHVDDIRIKDRRVEGVVVDDCLVKADSVIFAGDAAAVGAGLLGRMASRAAPYVSPRHRSLSAVTFVAQARSEAPLDYHTVAFGPDYPAEFKALFGNRTMPEEPTVYVCAPEPPAEPGGTQGILIILNAPADGDIRHYGEEDIARCKEQVMATLGRCGLPVTLEAAVSSTPTDFAAMLPGTGGAIYGRASHGWTASFQRPALRTRTRGLYLAGGSVHPGPGVPMSALSGQMAAEALIRDFALTRQSRPAAMSGGTSMGSARTATTPSR